MESCTMVEVQQTTGRVEAEDMICEARTLLIEWERASVICSEMTQKRSDSQAIWILQIYEDTLLSLIGFPMLNMCMTGEHFGQALL